MGEPDTVEVWAKDALRVVRANVPSDVITPELDLMQDGMYLSFDASSTLVDAFKASDFYHTAIGKHEGYITRKGDPCGLAFVPAQDEPESCVWFFYDSTFAF